MSAHSVRPVQIKYTALVETLIRQLRNMSPSLVNERMSHLVEELIIRMAQSNHDKDFRLKVSSVALGSMEKYL